MAVRYVPIIRCLLAGMLLGTMQKLPAAEPAPSGVGGGWKLISVEIDGETRPIEEDVRWLIQENQVLYGGEPLATVTSYPTSTPKGIDLAFVEPSALYEGIYALENDELKICLNVRTVGPKERPFEFATKDKSNLRILTFQRLTPANAAAENAKGFIGMALAIENESVVIGMVLEKSPAEKAGLRAGDVVLTIGNDEARDLQTTVDVVRRKSPGSNVVVRVRREGQEKEIAVRVAAFPFALLGLLG